MNNIAQEAQQNFEQATALRKLWIQLFTELEPEAFPGMSQFYIWLNRSSAAQITKAIQAAHFKAFRLNQENKAMEYDHQLRYVSAVLRNMATTPTQEAAATPASETAESK